MILLKEILEVLAHLQWVLLVVEVAVQHVEEQEALEYQTQF
tara:strand:- start:215 stop:337 length:123 start_codon:yes stop_codon:yes gene_type:complete